MKMCQRLKFNILTPREAKVLFFCFVLFCFLVCITQQLTAVICYKLKFPIWYYYYFFLNLFIYLSKAVLGLRSCARALSSCGKRWPLFIAVRGASHYRGLSCCGAQAPDAQVQQSRLTGPAAPWHVGSSQTRARTRVPRIGRQTFNHCATREAPKSFYMKIV